MKNGKRRDNLKLLLAFVFIMVTGLAGAGATHGSESESRTCGAPAACRAGGGELNPDLPSRF
jgi:hypothetical protein